MASRARTYAERTLTVLGEVVRNNENTVQFEVLLQRVISEAVGEGMNAGERARRLIRTAIMTQARSGRVRLDRHADGTMTIRITEAGQNEYSGFTRVFHPDEPILNRLTHAELERETSILREVADEIQDVFREFNPDRDGEQSIDDLVEDIHNVMGTSRALGEEAGESQGPWQDDEVMIFTLDESEMFADVRGSLRKQGQEASSRGREKAKESSERCHVLFRDQVHGMISAQRSAAGMREPPQRAPIWTRHRHWQPDPRRLFGGWMMLPSGGLVSTRVVGRAGRCKLEEELETLPLRKKRISGSSRAKPTPDGDRPRGEDGVRRAHEELDVQLRGRPPEHGEDDREEEASRGVNDSLSLSRMDIRTHLGMILTDSDVVSTDPSRPWHWKGRRSLNNIKSVVLHILGPQQTAFWYTSRCHIITPTTSTSYSGAAVHLGGRSGRLGPTADRDRAHAPRAMWSGLHARPGGAVDMFKELRAKPTHWVTPVRTEHSSTEPPELLRRAGVKAGVEEGVFVRWTRGPLCCWWDFLRDGGCVLDVQCNGMDTSRKMSAARNDPGQTPLDRLSEEIVSADIGQVPNTAMRPLIPTAGP
ncbi:hypothetical protein C8Q76DRAFT_693048 [Earliella scabrosa]|nr:hypothetical protein C8Q76DRAFT_693048 [Earliella scabrosa]